LSAPAPLPPIVADRIQLQPVLPNLFVNAIDAMSVTPGHKPQAVSRDVAWRELAELSISDRGPGIPARGAEGCVDPFFFINRQGEGMGIWLSIGANPWLEAHNGQISAVNSPDAGAEFRF